jgi:hypothetical protein
VTALLETRYGKHVRKAQLAPLVTLGWWWLVVAVALALARPWASFPEDGSNLLPAGASSPFLSMNSTLELQVGSQRGLRSREKLGSFRKNVAAGSYRFCFAGFRRRTPGPPPFSSMNSMPAASKARSP